MWTEGRLTGEHITMVIVSTSHKAWCEKGNIYLEEDVYVNSFQEELDLLLCCAEKNSGFFILTHV